MRLHARSGTLMSMDRSPCVCSRRLCAMEKKAAFQKAKNAGREDKPGVIVAGPQAHARERAGKTPAGQGDKPKDTPAGKPAARP